MERSKQLNNRTYKFSNEYDNRALPSVASLSCSASLYASSPPRGLWREKVASAIEKNDNERGKVLTKHATEAVCVLYRESSLLTLPLAAEWVNFPDASLTISRRVDEKHHMSLSSRRSLGAPPWRQAVVALYRPSYMSTSFTSRVVERNLNNLHVYNSISSLTLPSPALQHSVHIMSVPGSSLLCERGHSLTASSCQLQKCSLNTSFRSCWNHCTTKIYQS